MTVRTTLVLLTLTLVAGCGGPTILKTEPVGGAIGTGDSVLVDDGRCPSGQLSKITGPKTLTGSRTYACVPKP